MMRAPNAPSIYRSDLFRGKVAIVTGGGTGIGKSIAHELALLGCTVVIAARNNERIQETARELRAAVAKETGQNSDELIFAVPCDIRSEEQVAAMIQTTLEKFKRIDFLVNNAGGQFLTSTADLKVKGWEAVIRTNLTGTFIVTKQVYHSFMKEHGGSIVNIIVVMDKGCPVAVHSAAARAGVENLTKSLAVEWASSGIRVNCVAPGVILSSGVNNYGGGEDLFHFAANKLTCAKRVGSVEEVSAAVLYYLSPASAYTTGTTLHVDGGWHLVGSVFRVPDHEKIPAYGTITKSKL
ncbi:hypothetical protein Poli38472_008746 [Pythium oligandrum]|uniref:Peroxisomal trans-2-enoyl-CoA reductase n=1 Tax=Pythium oligandrum TaxID=41045 RepID=A0A8K1FER4_PYTOL|nr:hypothetical protein Poli38472_008746 [Pythium oligandrum]|eukprot:TMW56098.1 hypothetical protein Poli38472_008746 [Pythium oligandrum]